MSDTAYPVFQHYGTNAQRLAFTPSPASGTQPVYLWYETDTNNFYIYTTAWNGPYGASTAINFVDGEVPSGVIDGTNVNFTLSHAPNPSSSLHLYLGLRITQAVDYTLSGAAITMNYAPQPGQVLVADYRY